MHIGLIGGIGPGATDFYYKRLISTFARKNATLELTIVHADTPTLLSNLYPTHEPPCFGRGRMCRRHIDCGTFLHRRLQGCIPASRR
jgi:hypothetical protein